MESSTGFLEALGFDVVSVGLGAAAIDLVLAQPNRFRRILLDLALPDQPGRAVRERLAKVSSSARVVLTSGYDRDAAGVAGTQDEPFLHKPYDLHGLEKTLASALRG